MSDRSKATTLEQRPIARAGARSRPTSQSEERRDQAAVAIGGLYRRGREAMLDSFKYYFQAGRKLIHKKDSMPHGEWLAWLRANADVLGFKHRTTASRLMKAAAVGDASTHPLNEAEAIQLSRKLWGNPAAAGMSRAEFYGVEPKKKKSPKKWSATEVADRCIETVRATIEHTVTGLRRAHASRAKFELLFEALGEILVDVQRRILEFDDQSRRRMRRLDQN
jgi:hypothetical protein